MPTTSDYLTQLQQDRENLVDNLETQGIDDLTGDETFTELVPKVLDIQTGGGDVPLLARYDSYYITSSSNLRSKTLNAGNIAVSDTLGLKPRNKLFKRTSPKKGLICFFVRSNYTVPSDLVVLAETDWHINNDPLKQKLVVCWCNDLTADYTITQEEEARIESYNIMLKDTNIPTNIILNTILNITDSTNLGYLEVNPTNKMCIYICSTIYNYTSENFYFDDKFVFSDYTERLGIFISTNNEKKRVATSVNSYGVIGIELEYSP